MLDLLGLQGLPAPRGLMVLRVIRVYLGNRESSARGVRKVKVDHTAWTAFLDPLVRWVNPGQLGAKDTPGLPVFPVKLDFQANTARLESLVFPVKTGWTAFLGTTAPRG